MTLSFAYHLVRADDDAPVTDVYAIPWRDGPVYTLTWDGGCDRWLCRPGLPVFTGRNSRLRLTDRRHAEVITAQLGRVLPSERHLTRVCDTVGDLNTVRRHRPEFDPLTRSAPTAGPYWPATAFDVEPVRLRPQVQWWVLPWPNPHQQYYYTYELMVSPPVVVLARAVRETNRSLLDLEPKPTMTELSLFDLDTGILRFRVPDPAELLGVAGTRLIVRRGDRIVGYDVWSGEDSPAAEEDVPASGRRPDPRVRSSDADQVRSHGVTYSTARTAWDERTAVLACEDDTEVLWRFDLAGFDNMGPRQIVPVPGKLFVLSENGGIVCLSS
jgi:hypothetical protein